MIELNSDGTLRSRSGGRVALVSALDWGLGHASRSSVVVSKLLERGWTVLLAGSGRSLQLLRADHPDLEVIDLPGFSPRLSAGNEQWLMISLQLPQFLYHLWREHRRLQKLLDTRTIDMVVSDNRYGLYSSDCTCYLLTHQLRPRISAHAPEWLRSLVGGVLRGWMRKFDGCLVPDYCIGGLSGDLSSPVPEGLCVHCIGALSRLANVTPVDAGLRISWLGIVSGPEPQRTLFQNDLQRRFAALKGRRVIVCGLPQAAYSEQKTDEGIEIIPYADSARLRGLIEAADEIVARSGYSTVMDLYVLGKTAHWEPTPGQAEQEYLAAFLNQEAENILNRR